MKTTFLFNDGKGGKFTTLFYTDKQLPDLTKGDEIVIRDRSYFVGSKRYNVNTEELVYFLEQ